MTTFSKICLAITLESSFDFLGGLDFSQEKKEMKHYRTIKRSPRRFLTLIAASEGSTCNVTQAEEFKIKVEADETPMFNWHWIIQITP